jgi:hypothetical protein
MGDLYSILVAEVAMNISDKDIVKGRVVNDPLDKALITIIYELKNQTTAMQSALIAMEVDAVPNKEAIQALRNHISQMLEVIDELMIDTFLPRLQSNPDT